MVDFALSAFAAIFAIVNPVGNLTFFVALTEGYTPELRRKVINKVILVASVTLLVFALLGNYIFMIFHTSIPAFRIAGGILLFSIAFVMLWGGRPGTKLTDRDRSEAMEQEVVGAVPLGVPMFAGPGSITTVMVFMAEASSPTLDLVKAVVIVAAILGTMAASYFLLLYSDRITKRMGRIGALAFSRIMGLILAAIAMQIILVGVFGAIELFG
ncbi:MAG: MarC family protein [Candidatus Thermoplasmatota archaeon]|nr:MarC family protein [Candidatus Thermoplasmatota archaeon]